MKYIPKIAGLGIGILLAVWMMAYWDVRQADMVCDSAQVPDQICQEPFIESGRLKRVLEANEGKQIR